MCRDYYVYVCFRPWDGSPFYVGKGRGKRSSELYRPSNRHFMSVVAKAARLGLEVPIVVIRSGLFEREAFEMEKAFIRAIGRKKDGGPLVNQTDGGDGVSGLKHSEETRRKVGERSRQVWSDEGMREKIITAQNVGRAEVSYRKKRSQISRQMWSDPARRAAMSETKKKQHESPALREKISLKTRAAVSSEEMRIKISLAQKKRFEDPTQRAANAARAKIANQASVVRWARIRASKETRNGEPSDSPRRP